MVSNSYKKFDYKFQICSSQLGVFHNVIIV